MGSANWIYKVVFGFTHFVLQNFSTQCITIQNALQILYAMTCRVQSWRTLPTEYFLVIQVLATFLSLIEIYGNGFGQDASSVLLIGLSFSCIMLLTNKTLQLNNMNKLISLSMWSKYKWILIFWLQDLISRAYAAYCCLLYN